MMNILIFIILCVIEAEVSCKKALLFNLETRSLADVRKSYEKCPPYLTACPASTPQEIQLNKNLSLGKRSLFSRIIYAENETAKNIAVDFCEKSIKPTMLYNTEKNVYEIGYEIYFEDGKIKMIDKTHHHYKPVYTEMGKGDKIMNVTIPFSDGLIFRYEDKNNVKFSFTDGSRCLVFYWIEVLSIKSSKYQKRIKINDPGNLWEKDIELFNDKCENYGPRNDTLYSKENQKKYLSDIWVPASFYDGNPDMECGQACGCLEKYQISPLWYFDSSSARLASCSHINVIPVWKSLIDQLRKVDLYVFAILRSLASDVTFGVSGILKMNTSTTNPCSVQKMYLLDPKHRRKVPIPKIIYRIIKANSRTEDYDKYTAAIIFHNDPTADSIRDRLCGTGDTPSGWDRIHNEDPRIGLTYVCPVTEKLNDELKAYDNLTMDDVQPLNLDSFPYYQSYTYPREYSDEAVEINEAFEKLVNSSKIFHY